MTERLSECPVCGHMFKVPARGRTKVYCSADCRMISGILNSAEKMITRVQDRCTPKAWRALRGRVFGLTNGRAWNRGLKVEKNP